MKVMIEVGANNGDIGLRYHSQGYTVFAFEPKKEAYERVVEKTSQLSDYMIVPKAVCSVDGKTQLYICRAGNANSILPFKSNEHLATFWGHRTDVQYSGTSYDVETIRLDTFIEAHALTAIDFIYIEAQGVDLDVLKSAGRYIKNIKAGQCKTVRYTDRSVYETKETLDVLIHFLYENGFTIKLVKPNDMFGCEYTVSFERKQQA